MPIKKIIKKSELDQFYTNPNIAGILIKELEKYLLPGDILVEPSAGNGSFYNQFPPGYTRIGLDLSPMSEGIIKQNWFEFIPPKNSVIIGNPPFGERNNLTKDFICHSINSKARMIAFILPAVFGKETLQKIFPNDWSLVEIINLPDNAFLLDNLPYHVPSVFQIWIRDSTLPDLRENKKAKFETNDFTFVQKSDKSSEIKWFMFGAAPANIIPMSHVNPNNRGYYITCANPEIVERLRNIPWKDHALSSVNGGVAWYTKQQILNVYGKIYYEFKQC